MPAANEMSPVTRFVRSIEGDYLTLAEVARTLRIPEPTLRSRRKAHPEIFGPSVMTYFGDMPIYLYSLDDLERVRRAGIEMKQGRAWRGRPRLWTVPEQRDRQRRQTREYYWRRQAARALGRGDRKEAARCRAQGKEIRRGLNSQLRERERALR